MKQQPKPWVEAPFTEKQVQNLKAWQNCDEVHPFTCCDHQTMTVDKDGFHCPKCGKVQTWCHDYMASGWLPRSFKDLIEEMNINANGTGK